MLASGRYKEHYSMVEIAGYYKLNLTYLQISVSLAEHFNNDSETFVVFASTNVRRVKRLESPKSKSKLDTRLTFLFVVNATILLSALFVWLDIQSQQVQGLNDLASGELALILLRETSMFFFVLALLTVVATRMVISNWTVRPVKNICEGLEQNSAVEFELHLVDTAEIGQLARAAKRSIDQQEQLDNANGEFMQLNTELLEINEELELRVADRTREIEAAIEATILGWCRALEARDRETDGHSQRVAAVSVNLARHLGLSEIEIRPIYYGALLHDIGKIGIPDSILLKPGKLTAEEFETMKTHAILGYEMLREISFLRNALDIPLYHHEKWDGSGYPTGISGENIPFAARLFAIADVWDAMRSLRPYHLPMSETQVRAHIEEQSGKHFDPKLVKVFLELESMDHPSDNLFEEVAEQKAA